MQERAQHTPSALELRIQVVDQPGEAKNGADITLIGNSKNLFGTLIPYYRLRLGARLDGPDIPSGRIRAALERIQNAFHADRNEKEPFAHWAERKGRAFFTELLEDFTTAGPGELALLLEDYDNKIDSGLWKLTPRQQLTPAQENRREQLLRGHQFAAILKDYHDTLLAGANTLLGQYGIEAADNLDQASNLLALHVSGQARLLGQFHELLATLKRAQKVATVNSLRRLGRLIDQWRDNIEQGPIPIGQYHMPHSTVLDISRETPPLDYMRARLALSSTRQGEVRHFLIRTDQQGKTLISNLQAVGFEIVAKREQGSLLRISVQNPGRRAGNKPSGDKQDIA